jgi:ribosomal protein L37AE/L43A
MILPLNKETPEPLKPYEFHGVDLTLRNGNSQAQAECPFCGSLKFFINKKTGQYSCKKCASEGNKVQFLSAYHKMMLEQRTISDLKQIRKLRDNVFPSTFLGDHGLCLDDRGNVLFPTQSPGNKCLSNLRKWQKGNKVFYNTPSCCSLYFAQWSDKGIIFVCEGEWDALALKYLMERAKHTAPCSIVAVPGAGIFKESWVKYFKDRNTCLLYDNDHDKERPDHTTFNPAKDGMAKVTKMLSGVASDIRCIDWTLISEDLPDGYDVRDYLKKAIDSKKSKLHLKKLISACKETDSQSASPKIKTLKRTSFDQVINDWSNVYEFNQTFQDVLACCFATLISLFLSDRRNPLWLFIVAPPSCLAGKTKVTINRAGKSFQITLEDLYHRFHGGMASGKTWRDDIDTYIQQRSDEDTVRLTKITDVIDSGIKNVYEVTTESGKTIEASVDHKFYTPKGWLRLSQLDVGDYVISNAGRVNDKSKDKKVSLPEWCGLKYHPYASKRTKNRGDGWKVGKHRIVIEAFLNELSVERFIHILRYDEVIASKLNFLNPKKFHVHHKDRDRRNFNLENLEVLSARDHLRHHAIEDRQCNHVLEKTRPDKIVSIKKVGPKHVYDISVEAPHNFLANGIVVHNSGKTTIIEGFKAATQYAEYLSELTPASLVTGLKLSDDYDPSLLSRANEKVWFIEDFTPILTMPGKDEVFGIFRAAYNGYYTAHFATHVRDYPDLHFAIVSGVTHVIERTDMGDLGERFLRIRLIDETFDEIAHVKTALRNVGIRDEQKHLLLGGVNGFIEHLMANRKEPEWDDKMDERLINLSLFTALMRASVHRDKSGIANRPTAEVASRIATELKKLGIGLGVVFGKKVVDEECYRIMQKVAYDTCVGWFLELVQTIHALRSSVSLATLAKKMNVHTNQVRRIVDNAMLLNIVTKTTKSNNSGRRGNRTSTYELTPQVINMIKDGELKFISKNRTHSVRTKRSKKK